MPLQDPSPTNGSGATATAEDAHGSRPGSNGSIPVDWERLARATTHPLRVAILEALGLEGGRTLSPKGLSNELRMPLSNTNYHVTELAKAGLVELVGKRQVRGATEHFYRLPLAAPMPGAAAHRAAAAH
jgi:DNA-binding transcriptional ArsR family regulator